MSERAGPEEQITRLLTTTTVPADVVDELVGSASELWLDSAPPAVLATDLALCHPALAAHEVRAVAHRLESGLVRLTVVARDRNGLLADTAAVLAAQGVSVVSASAATWSASRMALHALTVRADHLGPADWDEVGRRLRAVEAGEPASVAFAPAGRAGVVCSAHRGDQRMLFVSADDQVGLLWAICRWLADHGLSIESAHVDELDGRASDRFVIIGDADVTGLRDHLSGASPSVLDRIRGLLPI